MRMHFKIILAAGLATACAQRSDGTPGSALDLLNAYLVQAARSNTGYRAEIRAGADPSAVKEGRLAGESSYIGPFTYRPKTYSELIASERASLLRDPDFREFLEAQSGSEERRQMKVLRFAIAPDEMLRGRPFVIVLPSP